MKLEIPLKYKSIGLMFSGDMDSTLLLYHLGRQYSDRDVYAFTAGSCGYVSYPVHIEFAHLSKYHLRFDIRSKAV